MAQVERQQAVLNILRNLRDLVGLKKLFWEELNYKRENKPLSLRGWPDSACKALSDGPVGATTVRFANKSARPNQEVFSETCC